MYNDTRGVEGLLVQHAGCMCVMGLHRGGRTCACDVIPACLFVLCISLGIP